jgi:hypothetical protein
MNWAVLLQVTAGVCAAMLTVGRPYMRSDSGSHKVLHTIIGVVGIASIVGAGILNWSSQNNQSAKMNELVAAVDGLGQKIGTTGDTTKVLQSVASTIDRLNNKVGGLEREAGPRHLLQSESRTIAASLALIGRQHSFKITFRAGDDEAAAFAADLDDAFIMGGWRPADSRIWAFNTLPSPSGVAIDINTAERDPRLAGAIRQALVAGGVKVSQSPVTNYTGPDAEVEIYVGARQ